MLSFLALFWMVGNVTVAGGQKTFLHSSSSGSSSCFTLGSFVYSPLAIAWAIIPMDLDLGTKHFHFNSWRVFVLVSGLFPGFVSVVLHFTCPESPKFLLETGREREAVAVLAQMFSVNSGKPEADYLVRFIP